MEQVNQINERIVALRNKAGSARPEDKPGNGGENTSGTVEDRPQNHGKAIFDATACPQDIAYPTDLDLLSTSREKSDELIDLLYDKTLHGKKPRT